MNQVGFSFGPFVLDTNGAELRRDGKKVPIRPKCFDLMLYLVKQPGRLITKEELLREIWSDVVVNEGTLNRTVTALRAALGDAAENPSYIETVLRRGYKFIAPVKELAAPQVEEVDFTLVRGSDEFPLHAGEQLIGRGYEVAIPLYASATSRHHARIVVSERTVTLEDLGSRNGTYVNGKRISGSVRLEVGDEICIGTDRFVLWSRTSETASAPVPTSRSRH